MADVEKRQTKFYFIPKERISNILDLPCDYNNNGSITMKLSDYVTVTLSDYIINANIVSTPSVSAYIGKVGTRANLVSRAFNETYALSFLKSEKDKLDKSLKQYEL